MPNPLHAYDSIAILCPAWFGEGGRRVRATAPYIWLGPRWYAWLEFGPDCRHDTFVAIARRVSGEFGGSISEVLPNSQDDGKEYAEVLVGSARLLLMRKPGLGLGLGASYRDVPLLLRVAALYRAECRGWRWPLYRLWQRLSGRAGLPKSDIIKSSL